LSPAAPERREGELVTLDEIEAAAARIRGVAVRTPVVEVLIGHGGPSGLPVIALKCENLQPMGAFKIRGAYNFLAQLPREALTAGVITYSSGNHGQALALAAARLGVPAIVVMPETAPQVKVDGVRRYGGEIIMAGTTSIDRRARAEQEAAARGLTIVPSFDHPWIVAGAGTCGLELVEQCPDLQAVYVPVGGGGLIAGVAVAVKCRRPSVRVVGVEPAGGAKMVASCAAGRPVRFDRTASIADGLLPLQPGDLTFAHVQAFVDDIVTVDDEAIAAAVGWVFREARLVAEPSGAASVAGALAASRSVAGTVAAIVSGGNVSPADFGRYIQA
jgi:threonine dehydratase